MPNLVGIGNSQVPINAMLGGLAYQDSVGEIDIDKIKARTSDTATDVFVYDTRKDSDGGAWRYRTEKTTWYNEGVSSKRGARKEFPVVAIIVCLSNHIKIYDGDDPNLPLWMDVRATTNRRDRGWMYGSTLNAVTALNGIIAIAANWNIGDEGGLLLMDFVKDELRRHDTSGGRTGGGLSISQRGTSADIDHQMDLGQIVDGYVNDVAMTVVSNTPIDTSTGLPTPTIAVATNGGVSVIKDDGVVVQKTLTDAPTDIAKVDFTNDGFLLVNRNDYNYFVITTIGGSESQQHPSGYENNINYFRNDGTNFPAPMGPDGSISGYGNQNIVKSIKGTDVAMADSYGLNVFNIIRSGISTNNMVAYITSNYNTGWMMGDIKGAFLSDTDDTNITGETIDLTNGSSVAGNWSSISANSIVAGVSGVLGRYDTGTDGSVLVAGKQYLATLTISNYNGSGDLGVAQGQGFDANFRYSANGTYHTYITYTSGEVQLFYRTTNTATIGLSLKEVDVDRTSRNVKGLGIHGTITKTHVAPNAELVFYSNFNATNFLRQEYNSDLNFGTGDFSIFVWVKKDTFSTNHYIIDRARTTPSWATSGRAYFIINYQGYHRFRLPSGSEVTGSVRPMKAGVFNHVGFVRRNGTMEFWLNGELVQTITGTNASVSFDNGTNDQSMTVNRFGNGFNVDYTFDGMALLRISGTAPSAEQVKKMYNDEKCLFHEKAKCTLHGTSDDVKALAFDDTNDVLHVGTSSGRSDFHGLNKINNTTTAVTTAISASNEFVAEQ